MKTLAALFAVLLAFGSGWTVARADDDNQGHHRGHYRQQNWQNGQCAPGRYQQRDRNNNDNDNDNDNDDNGRYRNNGHYGQYGNNGQYGRNRNNSQYCNGQYGRYGQYGQYGRNGQYGGYGNGQYGNGQYGGYGNNGQYGSGNAVIRGTITSVNGNQVTVSQNGYGNHITINDQPALDRQTSGRVSVGRYVTAYGYWQNGVFYATQMN